ncbi:hypothetical protein AARONPHADGERS_239 [Bacillus phage AaronPhadgers]|uniref:hypothetical protein n=1 Tax=Bacillus phage Zuko TaxID=1805956 RepID=UPI0007A774BC|nr:hypothetical protein BI001_gp146 [Bacillus phage Zuko]AMW62493.1 hypothetical protein ZUKO_232 [Bacillus phage Zuko]ASR78950.1 hypothetical protein AARONPHADGERS_239 [Bacillus phage AaronPhadgers]
MRRTYGAKRRVINKKDEKIALLEYDNYILKELLEIEQEISIDAGEVLRHVYHANPNIYVKNKIQEFMKKHEYNIITIKPKELM